MKINDLLKWVACAFVCIGAALTTFRFDPYNIAALNIGAVLYAIWGYRIGETNQVVVNCSLIGLYAIGLIIR
jgi:hypothetical protein